MCIRDSAHLAASWRGGAGDGGGGGGGATFPPGAVPLEVRPSTALPQPEGGEGVFVAAGARAAAAGELLCFYPGTTYEPHELRWAGGYGPAFERARLEDRAYLLARHGGTLIDGTWSGFEVDEAAELGEMSGGVEKLPRCVCVCLRARARRLRQDRRARRGAAAFARQSLSLIHI